MVVEGPWGLLGFGLKSPLVSGVCVPALHSFLSCLTQQPVYVPLFLFLFYSNLGSCATAFQTLLGIWDITIPGTSILPVSV